MKHQQLGASPGASRGEGPLSEGQQLCRRLRAIREEAKAPKRDFNLQWQLGRLLDQMERFFNVPSSELDALTGASPPGASPGKEP